MLPQSPNKKATFEKKRGGEECLVKTRSYGRRRGFILSVDKGLIHEEQRVDCAAECHYVPKSLVFFRFFEVLRVSVDLPLCRWTYDLGIHIRTYRPSNRRLEIGA